MDAWIVALGSFCCLYTAWELARLIGAAGRRGPAARPASHGAWETPQARAGQGAAHAADSRSGRPLRLRVDRRSATGRRTTDASAGEGTWSGAF